jgi:NAD(P)-dependent dehydrogenase (short-subunit alcohol dehydrogenase family)
VQIDTVAADLSHSSAIDQLARDFPMIDILVNNAGAICRSAAAARPMKSAP